MWYNLGKILLQFRIQFLLLLFLLTIIMAYLATKVTLSYEFTRAIPTNNQKFKDYQYFKKVFGDDGNTMVVGLESNNFFTPHIFNEVEQLQQQLKSIKGVNNVLSIPQAITLTKDTTGEKLLARKIFHPPYTSQDTLWADQQTFQSLPFYKQLLYNPATNAYLMAIQLNKDSINSKARTALINNIEQQVNLFSKQTNIAIKLSGLPYIRTTISNRIKAEMNWFLIGSLVLSAITLWLFFRSVSAMLLSLTVVIIGVIWSLGTLVILGYKITLLTALIPPLIVVIGIPNCIYFFNKYHSVYIETKNKQQSLITMVGRMGVVTLFCNIAAGIGFAVFALTKSNLLREFGMVAGINIIALFFISLILIPTTLSYLPAPLAKHTQYLQNNTLQKILATIELYTLYHRKKIAFISIIITTIAALGLFKLKSEAFIVDDLPKTDKIYTDLKWFENNFGGVMPLEILIDTEKKNGLLRNLSTINKIDEFSAYLDTLPNTGKPLSFVEGLKFAKQAFYDGDSLSYTVPYEGDMAFLLPYLSRTNNNGNNNITELLNSFLDSNKQIARISVNTKDLGTKKLPVYIEKIENKAKQIFDTSHYKLTFTGTSITFLEGSSFIIAGLTESIIYAFILISLSMLYLFKSARILLCSLIPNLIPLILTAGLMGWFGIRLTPATVLIFSVALGIVIDVTIRFLVNYQQELAQYNYQIIPTLKQTINHTGISIIYTSLVLITGFIIFCFSSFGGTQALGWLTSFTLVAGTLTNLVLLPSLLIWVSKKN